MTTALIILTVLAALAVGVHIGGEMTMRALRRGAYWKLTIDEQTELDRLVQKALAKRGEQ